MVEIEKSGYIRILEMSNFLTWVLFRIALFHVLGDIETDIQYEFLTVYGALFEGGRE